MVEAVLCKARGFRLRQEFVAFFLFFILAKERAKSQYILA